MKKFAVLILCFVMILSFAACGGGGSEGNGNADRELVSAFDQAPTVLDMHGTSALADFYGLYQVYDTLVKKDANHETVGSLADSWEISEDGLTYTFKLKEGVKFTNGAELTADDVVYSLTRAQESSFSASTFRIMKGVTKVDDYTVAIELNEPRVSFIEVLSGATASIGCKAVFEEFGDNFGRDVESVVGTGPYKVTEWEPGQLLVLEANDEYFLGAPAIKKARIKTIGDPDSAVIALRSGDLDLYFSAVPAVALDTIKNEEGLALTQYPSARLMYLSVNNESEVFKDKLMRQALAYAVDREKAVLVGADGAGEIVNTLAGNDFTSAPQGFEWYEHNPDKAKELVKEAGMDGATVVIKTFASGTHPKIATAIQDDLAAIGLNASVQQLEVNAMIEDLEAGNFDVAVTSWTSMVKDTGDLFDYILHSANYGITNDARYVNEEVDELLNAAASNQDNAERTEMYTKVAELAKEDCPYIPLLYSSANRAYSADLVVEEGNVEYGRIYDFSWK